MSEGSIRMRSRAFKKLCQKSNIGIWLESERVPEGSLKGVGRKKEAVMRRDSRRFK